MPGRKLLTEHDWIPPHYGPSDPEMVRRRQILRETISHFDNGNRIPELQRLAKQNVARWHLERIVENEPIQVQILQGDWGVVTQSMTRKYGKCFAVLNMANAFVPGGAYVEGASAQEENIFRRTDCHFYIGSDEYNEVQDCYHYAMSQLISAVNGEVYLDVRNPRVCVRGPEDRERSDLGYPWLDDKDVFPFFELRSAGQDLRDGSTFDEPNARRRIAAQLDTLIKHGVRHVVLGAQGCGAFMNPSEDVARIYYEEIALRHSSFTVIAFAIFNSGYGPDNFSPFANQFENGLVLGI